MKALRIIGPVIAIIALVLFVTPFFLPAGYEVTREIRINTSPSAVFPLINNLRNWKKWSAWQEADTTLQNTYSPEASGAGAEMSWKSEKNTSGKTKILAAQENQSIQSEISFDGFAAWNSNFVFIQNADGTTKVSCTVKSRVNYLSRWLTLFGNKMMEENLYRSLCNLKKLSESPPAVLPFVVTPVEMAETNPVKVYAILDSCKPEQIGEKLGQLYGELARFMQKNNLESLGAPMAYYYQYNESKTVLEAAMPVHSLGAPAAGRIKGKTMPGMKCIAASMMGDYRFLPFATAMMMDSIKAYGYEFTGPEFEIYVVDPTTVKDPMAIETRMFFAVK